MTYQTEVETKTKFQNNIVVDINGTKFAKYQIDSGLVIDADKLIVSSGTINPAKIDLKRANTTISGTRVTIIDKDQVFTLFMNADVSSLIDKTLTLYSGRITGTFDWSDYFQLGVYQIKSISKSSSIYTIQAAVQTDKMLEPIFDVAGNLTGNILAGTTNIIVNTDGDIFQSSGIIKVENEYILYTSTSFDSGLQQTTFTGTTRGHLNTTAVAHDAGQPINEVLKVEDNPINLLLQILISPGGGGTYDVLHDGVGISQTLVDITGFETIRDNFFLGETFTLYLSNIENTLKYVQTELLQACNIRLIENENGLTSITLLDQSTVGATLEELNNDNTAPGPKWKITKNTIQNSVTIQYAWDEGDQVYKTIKTFTDDDSIVNFGEKKGQSLKWKGFTDDSIATDRATRFLQRFSTPRAEIKCSSLMNRSMIDVGDKVRFKSDELPQPGGGLGLDTEIEVLSKAINLSSGDVRFSLIYTSYSNLRRATIAPAPFITSITSQSIFDIDAGEGLNLAEGDKIRLWDTVANDYESDPVNEILTISTDTITVNTAWITTLATTHRIRPADYNDTQTTQKSMYGSINLTSTNFDDGTGAYKIFL